MERKNPVRLLNKCRESKAKSFVCKLFDPLKAVSQFTDIPCWFADNKAESIEYYYNQELQMTI